VVTRLLATGLGFAVLLRLATFGTSGEWVAIALLWIFGLSLIVVRYRHARRHDRPDARLTRAEVRYGILLIAIAALICGPTVAASWVFTLAVLGFASLTVAVVVRNRRGRPPRVS
jgi:uncharacterized membrane protein